MSYNIGTLGIPIPASDGVICAYEGAVLFDVVVENISAPGADLIIYDNTAASGLILAVIPATGPNGQYVVKHQCRVGMYVSGTSGWTGSIYFSNG